MISNQQSQHSHNKTTNQQINHQNNAKRIKKSHALIQSKIISQVQIGVPASQTHNIIKSLNQS